MAREVDPEAAMRMATEIVLAYLANRSVDPNELPELVREVRAALVADQPPRASMDSAAAPPAGPRAPNPASTSALAPDTATEAAHTPAVDIAASVHEEHLVCLEDGLPFRSLRRHLMAQHGLTPQAYRRRWGLPNDYPMVAPTYAAARSEVAKRIGLGQSPKASPGKAAKASRPAKGDQ